MISESVRQFLVYFGYFAILMSLAGCVLTLIKTIRLGADAKDFYDLIGNFFLCSLFSIFIYLLGGFAL